MNQEKGRHGAGKATGERGVALLLVLWVLVLLAVLALGFSGTARMRALVARNLEENAAARWLADAGIRLTVRRLWTGTDQPVPDGTIYHCRLQSGGLAISVQDVAGLIDLNAAPPETLAGLFAAAGVDDARARRLAAAVTDFRDVDRIRTEGGAEAEDYAAAGLPHGPKNGPFRAVEELEQVAGMPQGLVDRVRPALTVHGLRASADLRRAPPLVRLAYGETEITELGDKADPLPAAQGTYRFTVTAWTKSGAVYGREAVLNIQTLPLATWRVLRWGQGTAPETVLPDIDHLPPC